MLLGIFEEKSFPLSIPEHAGCPGHRSRDPVLGNPVFCYSPVIKPHHLHIRQNSTGPVSHGHSVSRHTNRSISPFENLTVRSRRHDNGFAPKNNELLFANIKTNRADGFSSLPDEIGDHGHFPGPDTDLLGMLEQRKHDVSPINTRGAQPSLGINIFDAKVPQLFGALCHLAGYRHCDPLVGRIFASPGSEPFLDEIAKRLFDGGLEVHPRLHQAHLDEIIRRFPGN